MVSVMKIFITILAMFFSTIGPAHAYLDGGSASMILQLIAGGIAGLSAFFYLRVQSLRDFISRLFGTQKRNQDEDDESEKHYSEP
jgi:hypothetical protein